MLWLVTSAVLAAAGQLLYKIGVDGGGVAPIILALAIYGISTVTYLLGLKNTPLSVAYPIISISYVIVAVASARIFGESLTATKIAGVLLIIAGVSLIAR